MALYKLSDFDAVLAISRRGSFRAAALDLGMSTSALSNAIAKLEEQLGVRLFNRTTRSVSLTGAGRRFVDQVSPALRDIHQALDTVRSQQETPSGALRINTFATAGREFLAPLVLEFLRRFPDVTVDVVTEGNLVDIVAEGFDFGVRSQPLVPTDMIAIPLGPPRRYAVVAAPAYLENREVPQVPSDLLAHACIRTRLPNGGMFRWQFQSDGEPVHVDVDGPITLDEARPRADRRAGGGGDRLFHGIGCSGGHRGRSPCARAGRVDAAAVPALPLLPQPPKPRPPPSRFSWTSHANWPRSARGR